MASVFLRAWDCVARWMFRFFRVRAEFRASRRREHRDDRRRKRGCPPRCNGRRRWIDGLGWFERRGRHREEVDRKIAVHIDYVEDRDLRHVNLAELIAAAVQAVLDGYNEGLAINIGRVRKAGGGK